MKGTDNFKAAIKAHLENLANTNDLFLERYLSENKNIEDCIAYILHRVKQSGCNGFEDSEIYGMAVHYYQEENVDVGEAIDMDVRINHVVELSAEEKRQAKEAALRELVEEEKRKHSSKHKPPPPKADESKLIIQQSSLF